jgi:hypothetical protein
VPKNVTYHGPSDRLRVGDSYLLRNEPTDVPNHVADQAKRRCGERLTVNETEPADTGGHEPS